MPEPCSWWRWYRNELQLCFLRWCWSRLRHYSSRAHCRSCSGDGGILGRWRCKEHSVCRCWWHHKFALTRWRYWQSELPSWFPKFIDPCSHFPYNFLFRRPNWAHLAKQMKMWMCMWGSCLNLWGWQWHLHYWLWNKSWSAIRGLLRGSRGQQE